MSRLYFSRGCHNDGMNRLGRERSPYLLQHAKNPVDWFAWSDEAFAKARADDKPIFLSIGYSTCHWCHVMEHESFESAAVAAVLNEHFVSIKVDREERPDVDRVYMTFVQATTGSGGWPMSVWLTPDLKPFYGGTYFPPSSQWGRPGFVDILQEIARVWRAERPKVMQSAEAMTTQLRTLEQPSPAGTVPGADALAQTVNQFREAFDSRHGGFGEAPKFPRPSELLFLLREHARTGDTSARDMVLRSLRSMALGGMRDHIGGGFHRYSVDGAWRVPHFEKMLYDQAQLVIAFAEAAQASGDPFYSEVAEDTLLYVMREMTDAGGGFYSAEDADSVPPEEPGARKKEGAFYLWRAAELDALLGEDASMRHVRFPEPCAPYFKFHRFGLAVRVLEYQRAALNDDTHVRQRVGVHPRHAWRERHVPHPYAGVVEDDLGRALTPGVRLRDVGGLRPQTAADQSTGAENRSEHEPRRETCDQFLHAAFYSCIVEWGSLERRGLRECETDQHLRCRCLSSRLFSPPRRRAASTPGSSTTRSLWRARRGSRR